MNYYEDNNATATAISAHSCFPLIALLDLLHSWLHKLHVTSLLCYDML